MLNKWGMVYPECLNGRCTYNEDYRCKADGISEDIICQQGKDDALSQVNSRDGSQNQGTRESGKETGRTETDR